MGHYDDSYESDELEEDKESRKEKITEIKKLLSKVKDKKHLDLLIFILGHKERLEILSNFFRIDLE